MNVKARRTKKQVNVENQQQRTQETPVLVVSGSKVSGVAWG